MNMLHITESEQGGVTVLSLDGEADVYTTPYLKDRIVAALNDSERDLVLDLTALERIDACGLGTLIGGLKRTRERSRTLTLRSLQPRVRRMFDISGVSRLFALDHSASDAVIPTVYA